MRSPEQNAASMAFPVDGCEPPQWGLTKREWFAAMALQGFLAGGGAEVDPDEAASNVAEYVDTLLSALAESEVTP